MRRPPPAVKAVKSTMATMETSGDVDLSPTMAAAITAMDGLPAAVETIKNMETPRSVAIVGFAHQPTATPPYADPAWEIWSLGTQARRAPRVDVIFELHSERELRRVHGTTYDEYVTWLMKMAETKLVLVSSTGPFGVHTPCAVFPLEEVTEAVFGQHGRLKVEAALNHGASDLNGVLWTNTIAYMLGYALLKGAKHVGVWGVDMAHSTEYVEQRHGVTFLLGMLLGRGVEVHLPEGCALLHSDHVYGYQDGPVAGTLSSLTARLDADVAQVMTTREETLARLHRTDGVLAGINIARDLLMERKRGGLL